MSDLSNANGEHKLLQLQLEVSIFQEGDHFVSFCPALNLSSYGKTIEESRLAFHEALEIYIEYALENDTLEKDLLAHGWTLRKLPIAKYEPPANPLQDVPAGLFRQRFTESVQIPVC